VSTWFDEELRCPACGALVKARLARGVHVARAPQVRNDVLDRRFHRVDCPSCTTSFDAGQALVYTDFDRGHWVHVGAPAELARWPEIEATARDTFTRAFLGAPQVRPLVTTFRFRVVFDVESLREKLVLWAAGLDDAVIECVKLIAIRGDASLARPGTRLLVDAVLDSHTLIIVAKHRRSTHQVTIPSVIVDDAHRDIARLETRFPELFGEGYVSIDRLLGPRYEPARFG
jgi:hypothetical protein